MHDILAWNIYYTVNVLSLKQYSFVTFHYLSVVAGSESLCHEIMLNFPGLNVLVDESHIMDEGYPPSNICRLMLPNLA
jgi:hypothetical protein